MDLLVLRTTLDESQNKFVTQTIISARHNKGHFIMCGLLNMRNYLYLFIHAYYYFKIPFQPPSFNDIIFMTTGALSVTDDDYCISHTVIVVDVRSCTRPPRSPGQDHPTGEYYLLTVSIYVSPCVTTDTIDGDTMSSLTVAQKILVTNSGEFSVCAYVCSL